MSTTTNLKVTIAYLDATSRNYTIQNVASDIDPDDVKAQITAFNQAAEQTGSNVQQTFVSDNGARITTISGAEIITIEEEVIYNG